MSEAQSTKLILIEGNCGALLLATALSSIVFGITILQTYQYYDRYRNDSIYLKLFVANLTLLDTLDTSFAILAVWWYLIENYGNESSLGRLPVSIGVEVAMAPSHSWLTGSLLSVFGSYVDASQSFRF
ncbi:hypothetical protein CERSUDRAFT_99320 [Gelatoporia subvermispora B]|uniref:Uncharacterized protein n=1 Tax=Ceriporiopsis subvermispora (strain B) TaxID=914234 RepID=M2QKD6_CERS8|nr:hypothetical protein CERSUDRAFT_99320 [Gelatoporia subvermispora B]